MRRRVSAAILLLVSLLVTGLGLAPVPTYAAGGLQQVTGFGSNPGQLNMYSYLPANRGTAPPLVVALHGCTQSASDYYAHSGWPKFADLYGFVAIFAEQPNGIGLTAKCFDWGTKANDARDQGQALSIYQMVQYAKTHYAVDPDRIYITGLSAGGGMTANLLADYPDVFAAGSINSGPPAQCTTAGITDASCTSNNHNTRTPTQWGDLVRNSYPGYQGPWPRVQVWQGAADFLVAPVAMTESRDQWTNVWGISQTPSSTTTLPGNTTKNTYNDPTGKPAVETYSVAGMGHGLAIDPGSATTQCGTTGAYYLDTICSTYYATNFFGLDTTDSSNSLPAPTGLTVTAATTSTVALSWSTVTGSAGYNVYRDGTLSNTAAITATNYLDSGLTPGTTHTYTVAAVDNTGRVGNTSSPVTASTTAPRADCWTTDNITHNRAGRSYFASGESYAIGSNQDMGPYSASATSSLYRSSPGYWTVVDNC